MDSDHAAVPPATELHPDVSSDEVVRVRGRGRGMRRRGVCGGGLPGTLLSPWVGGDCGGGKWGGEFLKSLPQWADSWGESTRGHLNGVPSYLPPRTLGVGTKVGEEGVEGGVIVGGAGVHDGVGPAIGWLGCGPAWGLG